MDFDLAQVRAFVAVAEQLHFSRAAVSLHLTQQALSRRIQRLERHLGEPLFLRDGRAVELTPAGRRFLPHAQQLLAVAAAAEAETRLTLRPLRVDVWDQFYSRYSPLRIVRELATVAPAIPVETSMRRSLRAAIEALQRTEIDLAFGRVHDVGLPWPQTLCHQLVLLSPGGAAMSVAHPLAGRPSVRPGDLAVGKLYAQDSGTAPELRGYLHRFADRFGIPLHRAGNNLGLEYLVNELPDNPSTACLMPADVDLLAASAGVCLRPVVGPTPHYPWSAVWRRDDHNPVLASFLRHLIELRSAQDWTRFDPDTDWLPEPDLADLPAEAVRQEP